MAEAPVVGSMSLRYDGGPVGRALLDKHGLHDWRISVENLRNVMYTLEHADGFLGQCDLENKVIRIDFGVGRRFRQTLLHEIAHALVGKPGHGPEWIRVASDVGCTFNHLFPYVCKSLPLPRAALACLCSQTNHQHANWRYSNASIEKEVAATCRRNHHTNIDLYHACVLEHRTGCAIFWRHNVDDPPTHYFRQASQQTLRQTSVD